MQGTFQRLKDCGGLVQIDAFRQLKIDRRDLERLRPNALRRSGESEAQTSVDRLLERLTGAAIFLFEEARYIVVDGECRSHIMMFPLETS